MVHAWYHYKFHGNEQLFTAWYVIMSFQVKFWLTGGKCKYHETHVFIMIAPLKLYMRAFCRQGSDDCTNVSAANYAFWENIGSWWCIITVNIPEPNYS